MRHRSVVALVAVVALVPSLSLVQSLGAQSTPTGEAIIAWHVTMAPTWFDPSTAPPQITPFGLLYALHDAPVRSLPGQKAGSSLAESWTESPDGLVYEFKLRRGLKFHSGEPVTAEDVQFSFERYRGTGAKDLKSRVARVEVVDALTIRFHLKEPWPDFMTFYGTTATAVLHDAPGTPPRARAHDVEVPPRVAPDAVAGAEARVAPLGQPLALEREDADEPAVVLGDVDDVVGVHVEDRRADQRGGPGLEILALLIEHLHAVVLPIAYEHATVAIDPHAVRQVELTRARARLPPREQVFPVGGELVHAGVAVAVGDEHLARGRQGDVRR